MTDEDLDAINARANAAAQGPWRVCISYGDVDEIQADDGTYVVEMGSERVLISLADAAFIAAARTDVPALVAEVKRLREELRQCEIHVECLESEIQYPEG